MRDAKRSLLWISVFLIVVLIGDHVLAWGLHKFLVQSQFRYSRLYRGGNDADILIFGDSRGVHSFYAPAIEELTGRKVLNLSYNSLSPEVTEALLLDYLDRNRPPKMVILEVTSSIVTGEVLTELRPYAGLSPRLMKLYTKAHPYAAATSRVFHLLPLNSGFYIEALHYMRRSDQDWIMRSSLPAEMRAPSNKEGKLEGFPYNMAALARIADVLRQRKIELRLIVAPYYNKGVSNMPHFLADVARTVRPDEHIRIYNYVSAVRDPDGFADQVHLNEQGSRLFVQMLHRDRVFAERGGMANAGTRF